MRTYRLVCVLKQSISAEEVETNIDAIIDKVASHGGKLVARRSFGMLRLAYPMQRNVRGHYVILDIRLDPEHITTLRYFIAVNENVLRDIIVVVDDLSKSLEEIDLIENSGKERKNQLVEGSSAFLNNLSQFTTTHGRILPKHVVGLSALHMRKLGNAVKRRRYIGLAPFKA